MATSTNLPVNAVTRFLWTQIEAEGILSKTDYATTGLPGGVIPIVPIEESPDLLRIIDSQAGVGSLPYIVYTWTKINTGENWYLKSQDIAYSIRSADDVKTRKLINLFEDLFQDYDAAGRRINSWIFSQGTAAHKAYIFKTANISTLGGQMPVDVENGVNESLVTIRVTYTGG